ncbi:MAG: DUF2298 domain-containing protein [Thermoanaerobaculales bacterium]
MTIIVFLLLLLFAGLGGYAALVWLGLDDMEAWAGGRVAGLILVALPAWWVGVAGFSRWRLVGAVVLIVIGIVGGSVVWRRQRWRKILAAEAIFFGAALLVVCMRLDIPQILYTEKPMDLGILASLLRAEGFPPPDMWLAGETLPYYYWGALVWTVPISLSAVPLEIAYNLIVGLIGGMVAVLLWMLGRRAGGNHCSGLLVAFFGLFAGTPDGFLQLVSGARLGDLDYWRSSRQVTDTITEFPMFTTRLGDLHPHLLSIPLACLALLLAWECGRRGPRVGLVAALAVVFGVTWAANPWSMPPTLAGIGLLMIAGEDRWHWPVGEGLRRWIAVAAIAVGGWVVTAPFHLSFDPPFRGIAFVFAWTPPWQLLLYAGCLLVPAGLAALALLHRLGAGGEPEVATAVVWTVVAASMVLAAASGRMTLVFLVTILIFLVAAVLSAGCERDRPALALAALGVFLLVVPEVVYVVDSYGDKMHRMNTVFKAYIQAWILLAVALPVTLRLATKRRWLRTALVAAMIVLALPHPLGVMVKQFSETGLGVDGMRWMPAGDRAIVRLLRQQPPETVLAEAVGGAYSEYARLSAASGVPTYLGWANHELVWRGHEVTGETDRRRQLVTDLYSAESPERVRELAERAGIHLIAVGSLERNDFPATGLAAVSAAGEVMLDEDGALLIRVGAPPE